MILYRMSKVRHADDISGTGAESYGARWNSKGHPALYLAENRSLAILETIVHCQFINDLHNRILLSIEVPDGSMTVLDLKDLPDNWNSIPWTNYTIDYGTMWLEAGEKLLLKAPSAVVPKENIFIINPRHGDYKKVSIIGREIFKPDNRLALYNK